MKNALVLLNKRRSADNYLLTRIYSMLNLPEEKLKQHQTEISQLAEAHAKQFGGNSYVSSDQIRAINQVLKLINLGLESSSRLEIKRGKEDFDLNIAANILRKVSLIKIYNVGRKLFDENRTSLIGTIKKSEIKIKNLWFRLIDKEELDFLKRLTDLDTFFGTLEEQKKDIDLVMKIENLFTVAVCLPINECGFYIFEHTGSINGTTYPAPYGLIGCMLLSLIISCVTKSEEELIHPKEELDKMNYLQKLTLSAETEKERQMTADFTVWQNRAMSENAKYRSGDIRFKKLFFANILTVSMKEVAEFSDLIFFEPEKFQKKIEGVKRFFFGYFNKTVSNLKIKTPKNFDNAVTSTLFYIAEKVREDVVDFYKTSGDSEISKQAVAGFWHQRVCLKGESPVTEEEKKEVIAAKKEKDMNIVDLANLPLDYVLGATRGFNLWDERKKDDFIDHFNSNRFINEKEDTEKLAEFLKNIAPSENASEVFGEKGLVVYRDAIRWLKKAVKKIGWEHVHPSIVSEIWKLGTNAVRDALYPELHRIKISLPAIKDYFLFEHGDLRLLQHALNEAVRKDILRTKYAWDELEYLSENLGVVKTIIQLKRKEAREKLVK